jgi:hypothetical protein
VLDDASFGGPKCASTSNNSIRETSREQIDPICGVSVTEHLDEVFHNCGSFFAVSYVKIVENQHLYRLSTSSDGVQDGRSPRPNATKGSTK